MKGLAVVRFDDAERSALYRHTRTNHGRPHIPPLDIASSGQKRKRVDKNIPGVDGAACAPLFGMEQRCVSPHFASARRTLGFIDVGRTNMGLCFTSNDWDWADPVVERVARVDIADPILIDRPEDGSARETADLVAAFVVRWRVVLDACERVFIERQPPGGMRDIEQLLYAALGGAARVSFLAPNSLHAHFRIGVRHGWGAYDRRKVRAETIAARYICANATPSAAAQWNTLGERRHDAADATLMAILVNERKRREWVDFYEAPPLVDARPLSPPRTRAAKRPRAQSAGQP
ncbi:hypothetical protein pmac_cds_104 [Pandoravirus macleodensis]|uniref:Uncharacterized protein n=1 Tax=Pandoravirus macleodensis TaxID=2107707 RepID=A0A2U7UEG1_9VIRU|nr:hypothetical protein pmac_cds_104 [Pandoravirus macleodensis]AVK76792.1 hypothetical protein pmac_cds_104 [Pandoravirus macleodensis]